jgi:Na+-transporting methylmalonyl-CoA/oxaloacetate decarboxylase gamma subunit
MGGDLEIMDYSNLFVCLMGIGTVFVGLVCIVALVSVMSWVCRKTDRPKAAAPVAAPAPAVAAAAVTPAMVAAVAAVIAEEMGTSVDAIRIVSMKKL